MKFFPLGGLQETDYLFLDLILSSCLCLFILLISVYLDEYHSFFKKYLVANARFLVVCDADGTQIVVKNLICFAVINAILINRKFEIT